MWAQVGAVCILYTVAVDGEAFVPGGGGRRGRCGHKLGLYVFCTLWQWTVRRLSRRGGGGEGDGGDVGTSWGCMYSVHCGSGR